MYSVILGTGEPLQCEEEHQAGEEVPVSRGGEEECHQNGDGGHEAPLEEEEEAKPEEEHNGNRSADSPSEGQR